jgi:hypothetical protein
MTEQIHSNAKTNFDIHLNNAITKRNYVSRMKKFMEYCQVESYDELLFGNNPKIIQSKIVELRYPDRELEKTIIYKCKQCGLSDTRLKDTK